MNRDEYVYLFQNILESLKGARYSSVRGGSKAGLTKDGFYLVAKQKQSQGARVLEKPPLVKLYICGTQRNTGERDFISGAKQ